MYKPIYNIKITKIFGIIPATVKWLKKIVCKKYVIINVTIPVSMSNLLKGDGYMLLAKMGDVSKDGWSFKPSVDKKAMKVKLTDEGCTSNIAKVVENDNLTIK